MKQNIVQLHIYRISHLFTLVKSVGDKYPFGDDEILRIARCLAYLRHTTVALSDDVVNYSFLSNWAVHASTLPPAAFTSSNGESNRAPYLNLLQVDENLINHNISESDKEKRIKIRDKMLQIEECILPPSFGQKLEETVFALLTPTMTSSDNFSSIDNSSFLEDDLAMQRLEIFLNGLSDSSRRGSRKALSVIFNCCVTNTFKSASQMTARASDLLNLSYRLALASMILSGKIHRQQEQNEDKDDNTEPNNDAQGEQYDIEAYYPKDIDQSLVESLLAFSKQYSSNLSPAYMSNNFANHNEGESNDANEESEVVSLEAFTAWTESYVPALSATLETFIHYIFFADKPHPPSRIEFMFPCLRGQNSAFFKSSASPLLFSFAAMSPSLGGSWYRIYTSDEDGLSFNRLQNSLLGYGGPTLLIIKEVEGGGIFGAFTSTAWKETKDFYGNSDCFLFQLQPNVKVMRPRGSGSNNFMYCNSESRSRGYDGQSHGIGFGGTIEKPRLFIAESFDGCTASASDLTFEAGSLLPPPEQKKGELIFATTNRKYFEIEALEVWGVGGDSLVTAALGARSAQREVKAANIRKARKVDKAAFLDDLRSGLIESKAFKVSFFIYSIHVKHNI